MRQQTLLGPHDEDHWPFAALGTVHGEQRHGLPVGFRLGFAKVEVGQPRSQVRGRRAMPPTGRLLVVELLVARGIAPSLAKSQNANMLVNLGGHERTEAEYRVLFAAAGFPLTGTTAGQGELHIIEGVPV